MVEGRDVIQRDLDSLERWNVVNFMKCNKAKCKVRHMGCGNPRHKHRKNGEWIENSPREDLGVLKHAKFDKPWPCVLVPRNPLYPRLIPLCKQRGGEILPLCPPQVGPHLQSCFQLWGLTSERYGSAGASPVEAMEMF
ncbi:hypothetical protein DUI87_11146 [Hirundo rustica rustica]|uniref:Rna-directed dna polymerase from mobile element jockey-like n=1 Tax=Hirundo rustica rustica TaxID=333673 RepID=A0A3M0KFM9_HIRRU|nr:hypothetical protein DUI87_11146 [Hirundo rustica rustica]